MAIPPRHLSPQALWILPLMKCTFCLSVSVTHTYKAEQSFISAWLLSTVKNQTTAPTLNVNVLRRKTRHMRRRERERAGEGKQGKRKDFFILTVILMKKQLRLVYLPSPRFSLPHFSREDLLGQCNLHSAKLSQSEKVWQRGAKPFWWGSASGGRAHVGLMRAKPGSGRAV